MSAEKPSTGLETPGNVAKMRTYITLRENYIDKKSGLRLDNLDDAGKKEYDAIRKYYYKYILIPIVLYGSLKMIRPHFPYVVPYLENERMFNKADVEMWGIFTQYACFIVGIPLIGGIIGFDGIGGLRPIIALEVILQLYARIGFVLIKAPHFWWMISTFVASGLAFGAECLIFVYRTHIVDKHFYQEIGSWTSASFYLFSFLGGLISRFLLAYYSMQYLFYFSIGMVFVSSAVCYFTFPGICCRLNYCFEDLGLTRGQINNAGTLGYSLEHMDEREKLSKDKFIAKEKKKRNKNPKWIGAGLYMQARFTWDYIRTRENGLFWTLAWVIATICQWVIHAEIPMRWLDISEDAISNGLMDGLSSLGAMVGSLLPLLFKETFEGNAGVVFTAVGLAGISSLIYLLSVVNNLNASYVLFIAYQMLVTCMLSFITRRWNEIVNTEDPEGKVVMFIAVLMIALVVIGLQVPVRIFWHLAATCERLMFYFKVIGSLSGVCILLFMCCNSTATTVVVGEEKEKNKKEGKESEVNMSRSKLVDEEQQVDVKQQGAAPMVLPTDDTQSDKEEGLVDDIPKARAGINVSSKNINARSSLGLCC